MKIGPRTGENRWILRASSGVRAEMPARTEDPRRRPHQVDFCLPLGSAGQPVAAAAAWRMELQEWRKELSDELA